VRHHSCLLRDKVFCSLHSHFPHLVKSDHQGWSGSWKQVRDSHPVSECCSRRLILLSLSSQCVIEDEQVSRNHLEFYSIEYEEDSSVRPLIYVRDRQSQNGTRVNGELLGRGEALSTAWAMDDGDEVHIGPHLSFRLVLLRVSGSEHKLSELRQKEAKVCKPDTELPPRYPCLKWTAGLQSTLHHLRANSWQWCLLRGLPRQ
jgi:hypothetical protein